MSIAKIPYNVGKKTVGAVRKMSVKGTANAAMNVAAGAGIASMIPLSTTPSTDKDIDRMKESGVRRQKERNGRA